MDSRRATTFRAEDPGGRCPPCRTSQHIRVTEEHREWARETLGRIAPADRAAVSFALSQWVDE